MKNLFRILILLVLGFAACNKTETVPPVIVPPVVIPPDTLEIPPDTLEFPLGGATPFDWINPPFFQQMVIPDDNPLTVEGIDLGRQLFYDERLSGDNTQSCSECHIQEESFGDSRRFSEGINGEDGTRHSMTLINLGYQQFFFWDGRSATLEEQIVEPVVNPIEMNAQWPDVMEKIIADTSYMRLFAMIFSTTDIDSTHVAKAIAQFLRTVVSSDSKFDKWRRGEATLTASEFSGYELFITEGGDPEVGQGGLWGADCFHCHPIAGMQFSDYDLHNNGLDSVFTDLGRGEVTGNPADYGKFKAPSLRNVEFSAPYMHDGRFETLEEVIEHYNSGGHFSSTVDPFMKFTQGGLQLTDQKKQDLIAFLKALSDPVFLNNPNFSDPD
jgi:cytochrome c peroxidase